MADRNIKEWLREVLGQLRNCVEEKVIKLNLIPVHSVLGACRQGRERRTIMSGLRNSIKLRVVVLILAFVGLLTEPALSKKGRSASAGGGGAKTRSVGKSSGGARASKAPSARSSGSIVSQPRGMSSPKPSISVSKPATGSGDVRNNFGQGIVQNRGFGGGIYQNKPTGSLRNNSVTRFRSSEINVRMNTPAISEPRSSLTFSKPGVSSGAPELLSKPPLVRRERTEVPSRTRISSARPIIGKPIGSEWPGSVNSRVKPGSSISSSGTGSGIVSGGGTKPERAERPNKPVVRTDVRISNEDAANIGGFIRRGKLESREMEKPLEGNRPQTRQEHRGANRQNRESRESGETVRNQHRRNITDRKEEIVSRRVTDRISSEHSGKEPVLQNQQGARDVVVPKPERTDTRNRIERRGRDSIVVERSDGSRIHRERGSSRVVYEDRYRAARGTARDRYHHVYRDHRNNLCYRMISPRYRYPVYYRWGPWWRYRYVYPYYHRRYVFVSLGGYWPLGYTYLRYHWYPSHYYSWYGYYPIAREVESDTYNYYTYNYYSSGAVGSDVDRIPTVDHNTFADVREKLQQQGPDSETLADTYFDAAVKAFEEGDYATAAERFADAMELAPEDMILPFAYLQALFANEKYTDAVGVLRLALAKVSPEEEGVFYARGLYEDEAVLTEQIERLSEAAEAEPYNSDLQLLLGYHQLGIGETEKARESLERASQDTENAASASVLLGLVEKIAAGEADSAEQTAL